MAQNCSFMYNHLIGPEVAIENRDRRPSFETGLRNLINAMNNQV